MPPNFKQIVAQTKVLTAAGLLSEIEANAIVTTIFFDFYLEGIKQQPHYVPAHEIQMILDAIHSLSPESDILMYLVPLLIELAEDFYLKNKELAQDFLEKIRPTLNNLSDKSFKLIDIKQKNSVSP